MKRYAFCLLICIGLLPCFAHGAEKDKLPTTERALVDKILNCMQYQDTLTYMTLFPTFDTLWKQIYDTAMSYSSSGVMNNLMQHPEVVQQFDPAYNPQIVAGMAYVLRKGEDSGIHWGNITFANYELQKIKMTRDLVGYEKIAPVRFQGYVYIHDMVTRKTFMFTITEMQQINGYWYGGQVLNIFEASTIGEYDRKLAAEEKRKKMLKELGITEEDIIHKKQQEAPIPMPNDDDEETPPNGLSKRQVVDRKLFSGSFDNRIPVILYIRYIRGACPQRICMWEALYKIGKQEQYIKLKVSRTPDGKWMFDEDPTVGSMELELKNGVYTGSWTSGDNQTGYTVTFEEIPLRPAHAEEMDEVIQNGTWAKEPQIDKKKKGEASDYDEDEEDEIPADIPPPGKRGRH